MLSKEDEKILRFAGDLSTWASLVAQMVKCLPVYLPGGPQLDQRHVGRERRVLELGTFVPTSRQVVMGLEVSPPQACGRDHLGRAG